MLYFSRWKTISIWAIVLLGVLFALPNVLPQSGGGHARLDAEADNGARPRPAGRLAHPPADRPPGSRRRAAGDHPRRYPQALRDAKIGYTGLTGSGNSVQVRIRDQPQLEAAKTALANAAAAGRLQHVRGRHDHGTCARRAGAGRAALHVDGGRPRLPPRLRSDPVDRGGRPPHQRARHHRADHPAPGGRPHPRPGARACRTRSASRRSSARPPS